MIRATRAILVIALFVAMIAATRVSAQTEDLSEDSRVNTNLALTITAPLNPTSQFVNVGGGLAIGAGYNFSKRHSLIGEFMWNRLGASDSALAPIRTALGTQDIRGHGNLYGITGNYRYELRGKIMGVYFIGGGGWYRRTANLSTHVATGSSISCTRNWDWWGFVCESGTVVSGQTLAKSTSDVLGANAGMGITFKVAEPRYRMYIEARYHYAPTKNVKTEVIPVTFGIRF